MLDAVGRVAAPGYAIGSAALQGVGARHAEATMAPVCIAPKVIARMCVRGVGVTRASGGRGDVAACDTFSVPSQLTFIVQSFC